MAKVNFTKENLIKLQELALKLLFEGILIQGILGTALNIYQLLHETTSNTLQTLYMNLKREIDRLENADRWSLTDYQQRKIVARKEQFELIDLLIGYKKWQEQEATAKQQIANLTSELKAIEADNITPEEKIKQIKAKIAELGGSLEGSDITAQDL